jgi:hypothetical protein
MNSRHSRAVLCRRMLDVGFTARCRHGRPTASNNCGLSSNRRSRQCEFRAEGDCEVWPQARRTPAAPWPFRVPGKFRWTYDKPYYQLLVGDGEKLWVHDRDLNQVTVKTLGDALASTPAALLAGAMNWNATSN